MQNNLIIPQTPQEVVFKNANTLWLQALQFLNDSNYVGNPDTSFDFNSVKDIAWECPFDKGPAVLAARALMAKLNPKVPSFINVCETVQADENNQKSAALIVYEYQYDPTEEHDMDYLLKLDNITFANELKLYPNPSNSMVILESNVLITKLEISNAIGQVILLENTGAAYKVSIDLKDMPKGLYMVKVFNNDNFAVKQLSLID